MAAAVLIIKVILVVHVDAAFVVAVFESPVVLKDLVDEAGLPGSDTTPRHLGLELSKQGVGPRASAAEGLAVLRPLGVCLPGPETECMSGRRRPDLDRRSVYHATVEGGASQGRGGGGVVLDRL